MIRFALYRSTRRTAFVVSLVQFILATEVLADCTSILVSKGASADGSVFITYSADAPFVPRFLHHTGGEHEVGKLVSAISWEDDETRGQVIQAPRTHSVVGLMNDRQVTIAETTTGGRPELVNPEGMLDYSALMWLTLQRADSARAAIMIIDGLVNSYGYQSSGETLSIADSNEAWMMEIIGKGPGNAGAVWVAARVPDGAISVHANMSRIGSFPLNQPRDWLYSTDVVSFATERGFYDPDSGEPFSFRLAYHGDASAFQRRVCGARVWSMYRRACPDQQFSPDFHRGVEEAADYPLFVRPTQKLNLADVFALMRDHYEGTAYDMTTGVDAGPFGSPYRFRGIKWEVDGEQYCWERPISTQQAGFVMVSQCRSWLPDPIGGVLWYTPDDCYTSCFAPFYCGITELPESYRDGDINKFSWDSAWWIFNFVSNKAYDRWTRIWPDVRAAQANIEGVFLELQPVIDATASALADRDPGLMQNYLTQYSCGNAEELVRRWKELAEFLLTKHNDGYVNELAGTPREVGYPDAWLRRVVAENPTRLQVSRDK